MRPFEKYKGRYLVLVFKGRPERVKQQVAESFGQGYDLIAADLDKNNQMLAIVERSSGALPVEARLLTADSALRLGGDEPGGG